MFTSLRKFFYIFLGDFLRDLLEKNLYSLNMIKTTTPVKLTKTDKEDILYYLKHEVLPHVFNSCIPPMKDVSAKVEDFSDIWIQRQEALYQQALEVLVKEISKEIKK
jgi:hypothetical protein